MQSYEFRLMIEHCVLMRKHIVKRTIIGLKVVMATLVLAAERYGHLRSGVVPESVNKIHKVVFEDCRVNLLSIYFLHELLSTRRPV